MTEAQTRLALLYHDSVNRVRSAVEAAQDEVAYLYKETHRVERYAQESEDAGLCKGGALAESAASARERAVDLSTALNAALRAVRSLPRRID